MPKIRVVVLRGGPSSEHEVSLKTGESVLKHIRQDKYSVSDVVISKAGEWFYNGAKVDPEKILKQHDVVFNALHGEYGEDGQIQGFLDKIGIPYTGSGAHASAVAMDKVSTKRFVYPLSGVKEQEFMVIKQGDRDFIEQRFKEVRRRFKPPYIVKLANKGSSVGLKLARSHQEALDHILSWIKEGPILIEEYIQGVEATCGVVENLRGEKLYALPVVEIRPKGELFDYEAKYSGETEEICPGTFSKKIEKIIQNAAVEVHRKLGLRHYSRSDFIVAPDGIYFLEVNTLPGLTPQSLLPKSLAAIGVSFEEFVDHLIGLAVGR